MSREIVEKQVLSNGSVWIQRHRSRKYSVVLSPAEWGAEPTIHGDLNLKEARKIYAEYIREDVFEEN